MLNTFNELEIDHLLKALRSYYDKEGGEDWCVCCESAEKKLLGGEMEKDLRERMLALAIEAKKNFTSMADVVAIAKEFEKYVTG